jgi:hypothetical protein
LFDSYGETLPAVTGQRVLFFCRGLLLGDSQGEASNVLCVMSFKSNSNWRGCELRNLLDEVQPGAVLFLHLFHGMNSTAKVGKSGKFLLDCLQPLMSLAVSDMSLFFISTFKSILVAQLLKVCDLGAEAPNLFSKHC